MDSGSRRTLQVVDTLRSLWSHLPHPYRVASETRTGSPTETADETSDDVDLGIVMLLRLDFCQLEGAYSRLTRLCNYAVVDNFATACGKVSDGCACHVWSYELGKRHGMWRLAKWDVQA